MVFLPALLLTLVFTLLGVIHVYWAAGGRWGSNAVLPTKSGSTAPLAMPGFAPAFSVAVGLFLFAAMAWNAGPYAWWNLPTAWRKWSMMALAVLFLLRVMGEFHYVGLFKKVKDTPFAKNDNAIYIPLCLGITLLAAWLAWNQ